MEEEEGPINFKAIRAKFQEEAAVAQAKTRPAIADKPRCFQPPGGNGGSVDPSIHTAVETRTTEAPRVIVRNGFRSSGGKRPIIFPPQPLPASPPPHNSAGDSASKTCFKHLHLHRMLPVPTAKEQKAEPHKTAPALPTVRKKGLLLPFKSHKAPKAGGEPVNEPTYADLTTRRLAAMEVSRSESESGSSLPGERSASEYTASSPDVPVTPPSTEDLSSPGSEGLAQVVDQHGTSTLERAKKRFSPRNLLVYAKPRSSRANGVPLPDSNSTDRKACVPPKETGSREPYVHVSRPVGLPQLQCLSAIPFSRTNRPHSGNPFLRTTTIKDREDPLPARPDKPQPPPPARLLPELPTSPGPPLKPPRPPLVHLSRYVTHGDQGKVCSPQQDPGACAEMTHRLPSLISSDLRAPDVPDFECSEIESEGSVQINIAAIDLEALVFGRNEPPFDIDVKALGCEDQQAALAAVCLPGEVAGVEVQPNLYCQELMLPAALPGPADLPDQPCPEFWSQTDELPPPLPEPQAEETSVVSTEPSVGSELGSDVAVNSEVHSHASAGEQESYYEACDNVYEEVENSNKVIVSQNSRKNKVPKNPYAESPALKEDVRLYMWPRNPWANNKLSGEHGQSNHPHMQSIERHSPDHHEYKEHKKKEKQEKKEQKEREKKENEMKKKYKVTGLEEPMYHARVIVASKLRKNDLPVMSGDTVSIIRTTNCPKGKWLARNPDHKYGYISVMNVELNIKEMMELGKKAQAAGRGVGAEGDTISIGSRSSNHPILTGSFSDDSEEWTCEDETMSPSQRRIHNRTLSLPDKLCASRGFEKPLSYVNLEDLQTQTRREAIQKLSIFFQQNKETTSDRKDGETTPTNAGSPSFLCVVEEPPYCEQEGDFEDLEFLPPPALYADTL